MRIAARAVGLSPTAVNRVLREAREAQTDGRGLVSLMRGQPDTPTPTHIVEAAERALRAGRTGYPDTQGEPELRRAVAEKLAREPRDDRGIVREPPVAVDLDEALDEVTHVIERVRALRVPGDERLLPRAERGEHARAQLRELGLELLALAACRVVVPHPGQRLDAALEIEDGVLEVVLAHGAS